MNDFLNTYKQLASAVRGNLYPSEAPTESQGSIDTKYKNYEPSLQVGPSPVTYDFGDMTLDGPSYQTHSAVTNGRDSSVAKRRDGLVGPLMALVGSWFTGNENPYDAKSTTDEYGNTLYQTQFDTGAFNKKAKRDSAAKKFTNIADYWKDRHNTDYYNNVHTITPEVKQNAENWSARGLDQDLADNFKAYMIQELRNPDSEYFDYNESMLSERLPGIYNNWLIDMWNNDTPIQVLTGTDVRGNGIYKALRMKSDLFNRTFGA